MQHTRYDCETNQEPSFQDLSHYGIQLVICVH